VAAVARRKERLCALAEEFPDRIVTYVHDVHDHAEVPALFQRIAADLGGLDLFVYAAGVMPEVGHREYTFEKDLEILEVNVVGAVAWLDEAALRFDHVGRGTILAIGSRGGERGMAGFPVYSTSKAAIATYMEALRNRLHKRGVRVVTVKPGPVDTEMTAGLHMKGAMPVAVAGERILRKSGKAGEHFLKPSDRVICFIIRNFPSPLLRRLSL
jgi:NAD(P)-dependent dehydrogenase (short-subunit alcohol dehydrogenase family)